MQMWLIGILVLAAALAGVIMLVPATIRYTETIDIAAPASAVFDHIRLQRRLMQWSAWPSTTQSNCAVEGPDGEVGARTVFFGRNGKRFGHQEITAIEPGRSVALSLRSAGPPQRPRLLFRILPIADDHSRIELEFTNTITRPFNVVLQVAGVVRWTRAMHVKDLQGLKRFSEPPHLTYIGGPAVL